MNVVVIVIASPVVPQRVLPGCGSQQNEIFKLKWVACDRHVNIPVYNTMTTTFFVQSNTEEIQMMLLLGTENGTF